jgi:NAD(P)-dependent dehydrogenase (short-subunit alcohol dehydrogenase family)
MVLLMTTPDYGLTGRVALVTGGSRGIGRAIAAALLRAGCRVAIVSRDPDTLEAGRRALTELGEPLAVRADVSAQDDVRGAVDTVASRLGPVDILINNAAVASRHGLMTLTQAHWDDVMAVNVRSLLFACQAVAPEMMRRRWGRIISAASYAAWHPSIGRGLYAATKAAVVSLTKTWAGELAPHGITVNAYAPGPIATDMAAADPDTPLATAPKFLALQRVGTPEEVADVVVFLASERAAFLTGVIVDISGGKYVVQDPWNAWSRTPPV